MNVGQSEQLKVKFWILVVSCLVGVRAAIAQDPVFSQFYNAPIQLNPGLVGLTQTANISINYRNQWPGWPQAYTTYAASYDRFFDYLNSGLGVQVLSDNAGDGILVTNKISGVYAYRLQLNRKFQARIGLEMTAVQSRLDWDKLIFLDQIGINGESGFPGMTVLPSREVAPADLNKIYFDISMGGVVFSENYYVGFSLKHLNSPNDRFESENSGVYSGLPLRMSVHAGWEIDLDGYNNEGFGSFIAPSVLLVRQSDLSQLNAGGLYNKENFFVGSWLRYDFSNIDAMILSVGWRTEWLKLSYSFDLTLSSALVTRTTGSHEIGVLLNFGGLKQKKSRYEDCFNIFR